MKKSLAVMMAVLIVVMVLWGIFSANNNAVILINGQQIAGPLNGLLGAAGVAVLMIALICLAILLALAFAGVGIIIFGCLIVVVGVWVAFTLPFLFPVLIPLLLVWAFAVAIRRKN